MLNSLSPHPESARAFEPVHPLPLVAYRRYPKHSSAVVDLCVDIACCYGTWRWIFLGSIATLQQPDIDAAVATLTARQARWLQLQVRNRITTHQQGQLLGLWARASPQLRLRLPDVQQWTGRGDGVSFVTIAPPYGRTRAELDKFRTGRPGGS